VLLQDADDAVQDDDGQNDDGVHVFADDDRDDGRAEQDVDQHVLHLFEEHRRQRFLLLALQFVGAVSLQAGPRFRVGKPLPGVNSEFLQDGFSRFGMPHALNTSTVFYHV